MRTSLLLSLFVTGATVVPAATASTVPSDKAEIILEAYHSGGLIGCQMLLDADHSTYGDIYNNQLLYYFVGNYDDFEYLIPENADCDPYSTNAVVNGETSIIVPAGIYDFLIVQTHGDNPASGFMNIINKSATDDFEFKGGHTYRFKVDLNNNMGGEDAEEYRLIVDKDAAVTSLTLPANSPNLSDAEPVSVVIANNGTEEISGFTVSYQVNDGTTVTETYQGTIAAGATGRHTFAAKADMSSETIYNVKAWVSLDGDAISNNDTAEASCIHQSIIELPFLYDFSEHGEQAFSFDWTVINVDNDNYTWVYDKYDIDYDGDFGCADSNSGENDFLVSAPLRLPAGDNHITFYASCITDTDIKRLEVYYGTDNNPETFTKLSSCVISNNEWLQYVVNFNVEKDGVYYIAFKAISDETTFRAVKIDEVAVGAGKLDVAPKAEVNKLILPFSNCTLSSQTPISIEILNAGQAELSAVNISYRINNQPEVVERHEITIPPYSSSTLCFDTTADFSETNLYEVTASAYIDGDEPSSVTASVENTEPISDFPIYTNFAEDINQEAWHSITAGTWEYNPSFLDFSGSYEGIENGLMSQCLSLEHSGRIKLAYQESSFEFTAFHIAFGKAGDDLSEYTTIYSDYSPTVSKEIEVELPVTEPDEYNIVLYITGFADGSHNFHLFESTISEKFDNDLRIEGLLPSVALHTPESQLAGAYYDIAINNRGLKKATGVIATIYDNNTEIATSETPIDIEAGETVVTRVKADLSSYKTGDIISGISIKTTFDQEDQYPDDNLFLAGPVEVTDSEFATEEMSEFPYTVGLGAYSPISFGNIYSLVADANIDNVTLGFAEFEDATFAKTRIGFSIYRVNEDDMTLGTRIYTTDFTRGNGGLVNLSIPAMRLIPGKYYFEVQQYDDNNIGLAGLSPTQECCYQTVDGQLIRKDNATLAVRAGFNSEATVYATDATVSALTSPTRLSKLFGSDETISVEVRNNGYEASEFSVTCSVNGVQTGEAIPVKLDGYENVTVDFPGIDLSVPGEYTIVAATSLTGDENPANDRLTVTLTSQEPISPYTMDFESCGDFDISTDLFNPQWRSITLNTAKTDAFIGYTYPHREEAVGFISFNPAYTTPSMIDGEEMFLPHSGERFGAIFCPSMFETENDADAWLISPLLQLGTESSMELFVKTHEIGMYNSEEKYQLLVSDTDDSPESFAVIGDEARYAPQQEWTRVEADLSDYDSKSVYVAVRYIGEPGKNFVMLVDDITIKTNGAGVANVQASGDKMNVRYLQPEHILDIQSDQPLTNVEIFNVQGMTAYASSFSGTTTVRIPTTGFASGMYIARISSETGTTTCKFVVR